MCKKAGRIRARKKERGSEKENAHNKAQAILSLK